MAHGVWTAVTELLPDEEGVFFVWDAAAQEYHCAVWAGGRWASPHADCLHVTHWMRVSPPTEA